MQPASDLLPPDTDSIRLEAPPASLTSTAVVNPMETETFVSNCLSTDVSLNPNQSQAPTLPDPSTPCMDERLPSPLPFSDFEAESFALFSPLNPDLPSLQSIVDEPEASTEVVDTSYPAAQMDAELQAAVQSIIPNPSPALGIFPITEEDPTPGTLSISEEDPAPQTSSGPDPSSEGPDCGPVPSPFPAPNPDAPNGDILAQAAAEAQIEVTSTSESVASLPPPTGPADPRYFFFGAPSMTDDSPHARLIREARERAMQGWQQGNYSVRFTPMNLFALQKVESVRLPDGTEYSLSSLWVERPQPLGQ